MGIYILVNKNERESFKLTIKNNKLAALNLVNAASKTAEALAEAARVQRDTVLYAAKTGLVAIAMDSKLFVKSAYGARSPQYKSVSSILFTRHG